MSELAVRTLAPAAGEVAPDRAEVLRYLGYRPGRSQMDDRVEAVVAAGIARAVAVATPRVAAGYCRLAEADAGVVRLAVPGFTWPSRELSHRLAGAASLTLLVATVGEGPSMLVRELFANGDYAVATAVDAAATALVQALAGWSLRTVASEAAAFGYSLTPPYSPGYGDWDITAQLDLVSAIGAAAGVTCTPACYLIPEKSLVAVAGWVSGGAADLPSGCAACLQPNCPYRQAPFRPVMRGGAS